MMPGYNLLAADREQLSSKYLCSYCKLLLRDAKQTRCGHFYCESCVGNLVQGSQMICLEDNEIINPSEVYPDNFVRREVLSLAVRCSNADNGCKWKGEIKHLEVHVKICEFQEVQCIHPECGMSVIRRQLPSHLRTDCKHRTRSCSYCGMDFSVAKMTDHHKNECKMFPVTCPKCNKQEIPRDMMSVHLDPIGGECSELEGVCPFTTIGCPENESMSKDRRRKHLNEETTFHLSLLQKDYLDLKTRTDTQALPRSFSGVMSYPEGQKDKVMKDLMVKIDALMQDNVSMRRKLAEQTTHLLQMEQRLAGASEVQMSSAAGYKTPTDKESSEVLKDLRKRVTNVENSIAQLQVYHTDNIRRTSEHGETVTEVKRLVEQAVEFQKTLETRIHAQETVSAMSNVAMADLEESFRELQHVSYDGIFTWKITDVARKRTEAVTGRVTSFYSPQFYSSRQGYRMCARIYMNGDGMGKGNCISLFFVVMRGEYDALLRWPFRQKVTLMLLDQDNVEHIIDAFRPDPSSSSFQRPRGEMNIASGCPMFCPLSELDKHAYIRDDTMFIKIIVDTMDV